MTIVTATSLTPRLVTMTCSCRLVEVPAVDEAILTFWKEGQL
jgi:hypothetical protein